MKDFNQIILDRVDKPFNIILAIAACIAFLASIVLFNSGLSPIYGILNVFSGLTMVLFFINRKTLLTKMKVIAVICVLFAIGTASFIGGGFTSSFIILYILANIMSVLFLKRVHSVIISIITLILLCVMACYSVLVSVNPVIQEPVFAWLLYILTFLLLIIVFHISSYTIRTYLIDNIYQMEQAVQQANILAYYDELTQLPKANQFKKEVNDHMLKGGLGGYLMMFNLRSLRLINSTLGQEAGDQTIMDMAEMIQQACQEPLTLGRISGNEFALWIPGMDLNQVRDIYQRLDMAFTKYNMNQNRKIDTYTSYAACNIEEGSYDQIYQKAVLTMAYVKTNKIKSLVGYNDAIEAEFRRRQAIKEALEPAILGHKIVLYYQSKVDSNTGNVVGVEALARWFDETLGFVSPMEFIPMIESMNLTERFGNYVLERACMEYPKLQAKYGDQVQVSVNISPSHLTSGSIVATIEGLIKTYGIPDKRLVIEITEDVMIQGVGMVKPILIDLRKKGVMISLDDFGSGYSSLNYLTQLALHELKIDKSFIDYIEDNNRILIILENIIRLAKQFNLAVVAEGVEKESQLRLVNQLGCHIIQGYYYSKPEAL